VLYMHTGVVGLLARSGLLRRLAGAGRVRAEEAA
jgi:hypothetical protein